MPTKPRRTRPGAKRTAKPSPAADKSTRRAGHKPAARSTARPAGKPTARKAGKPAARPAASPAKPASAAPAVRRHGQPAPAKPIRGQATSESSGPTTHDLAVAAFERGFTALQRRDFAAAARLLSSVLDYPDEKELHERARVYLVVCKRQEEAARQGAPRTLEERMNGATVAINRGAYDEALALLRGVEREDADHDVAQYMLAVVYSALGDADEALPHLRRAMELNAENRYLAAQDPDLAPLRETAEFAALLESPPASHRRQTTRPRH